MVGKGFKPLVLNMASDKRPGGEWRLGVGALEETLYRRSTYCIATEEEFNRDKRRKWRCERGLRR